MEDVSSGHRNHVTFGIDAQPALVVDRRGGADNLAATGQHSAHRRPDGGAAGSSREVT